MSSPSKSQLEKWLKEVNLDIQENRREQAGLVDLRDWITRELSGMGEVVVLPVHRSRQSVTTEQLRDYIRHAGPGGTTFWEMARHFGVSYSQIRMKMKLACERFPITRIKEYLEPDKFVYEKPEPIKGPHTRPRSRTDPAAEGQGLVPRGIVVPGTSSSRRRDKGNRPKPR